MNLELKQLKKSLPSFELCVDHRFHEGVTGIYGPSGSGKTTLIEMIAGLVLPDSGTILFQNNPWFEASQNRNLSVRVRNVGYIPQDLALFPHLTVQQNLFYSGKVASDHPKAHSLLGVLELKSLLSRLATQLSGGERQRVAIGRALLSEPQLLLLDEPLSNLDVRLKQSLIQMLREIRQSHPIPMIYISHSQEELDALCDELLSINDFHVPQSMGSTLQK